MKEKLEKLYSIINVPPAAIFSEPRIEINSNKEISIDCIERVVKYDENIIKLKTKNKEITIFGANLGLQFIRIDALIISGEIASIEFESTKPKKR